MSKSKSKRTEQSKIQRAYIQKFTIGAAAVLLIVAAWLFFYFLPLRKQMNEIADGVQEWKNKIQSANISQEMVDNLAERVDNLKGEIGDIEKKIFYLSDMPDIAKQLVRYGKKHRLAITAMTPNYDVLFQLEKLHSQGKPLVKLPISIKMVGRFTSSGRFISNVSDLPFVFSPDGFVLEGSPKIYPDIDITVTGFLFLLNEEKKKEMTALNDQKKILESKG